MFKDVKEVMNIKRKKTRKIYLKDPTELKEREKSLIFELKINWVDLTVE